MLDASEANNIDEREFTDEELDAVLIRVGEEARRKAFAAGRPITILEGSKLVRIWPDGRREFVPDRTAQRHAV